MQKVLGRGVDIFSRKARGTEILSSSPRVFLCYNSQNVDKRNEIINDILSQGTGIDCVVTYLEDPTERITENQIRIELLETKLLIVYVTEDFLKAIKTNDFPIEYKIAQENRIPILPLIEGASLFQPFTDRAGAIHGLNREDFTYRKLLGNQLNEFLVSREITDIINKKAFSANIFLSYRKIDIDVARKFMREFHNIAGLQSVSIWYDNFLTAGRNFNFEITNSIDKSDIFVLLVTPNLVTKGNYVQEVEYPYAKEHTKKIIPIEVVSTDEDRFFELYSGSREPIKLSNTVELHDIIFKNILKLKENISRTNEQNYYLGMAYLNGQGLERDSERAIRILENCTRKADASAASAAARLSEIFSNGNGVEINLKSSLEWTKREVEINEKNIGNDNNIIAGSYTRLGNILEELGQFDESLSFFQKVLSINGKLFGVSSPKYAYACEAIAGSYYYLRQYDEAVEWHKKALKIRKSMMQPDELSIGGTYNNIAMNYLKQGKYTESIEYLEKAREIFERKIGTDDPLVANIYGNLGDTYKGQGDFQKAIEYLTKNLDIREKTLAKNHPRIATIVDDLGDTYEKLGNYDKALNFYQKALETQKLLFGEKSESVSGSYLRIGNLYGRLNKYSKGIEYYDKAIAGFESLRGRLDNGTYLGIGKFCYEGREFDKAIVYLQKAIEIPTEKVVGISMADMAGAYFILGTIYYNQKNYMEAKNRIIDALGLYQQYQQKHGGQEDLIKLTLNALEETQKYLDK